MTTENKTLEIDKDYGSIFGLPTGCKMIYLGGISWRAIKPGAERVIESQVQTDKVLAYVNQPAIHMGM